MELLLEILFLHSFFWITLVFMLVALIRAKHKDMWVWYIIGAAISSVVLTKYFDDIAIYVFGVPATRYQLTYIAILVISAGLIAIRRRIKARSEQSVPVANTEHPCPVCGKMISLESATCEHCGYTRQV